MNKILLHHTSGRWRLGLILTIITVLMWGLEPIALTIILKELDVYTLSWFRFLICFGLLAIYLGARQQLPQIKTLQTNHWKLLAIAIIFLSVNYVCFLKGLALTSPANGEMFIQLAPVLMGLGALVIFKERYNLRQWFGLGLLTLGFSLFFHDKLQNIAIASTQYLIGSGLVVVSAAAWAVYALAQKQLLEKLSSSSILMIIYGVCVVIFSFFANPQSILQLSPFYWLLLIFCVFDTLVAYGAFSESLNHLEASKVGAVLPLSPIITLIATWILSLVAPNLMEPEHISILGGLGGGLVVAGSIAIALGQKN